jgi:hypothetical protein
MGTKYKQMILLFGPVATVGFRRRPPPFGRWLPTTKRIRLLTIARDPWLDVNGAAVSHSTVTSPRRRVMHWIEVEVEASF